MNALIVQNVGHSFQIKNIHQTFAQNAVAHMPRTKR